MENGNCFKYKMLYEHRSYCVSYVTIPANFDSYDLIASIAADIIHSLLFFGLISALDFRALQLHKTRYGCLYLIIVRLVIHTRFLGLMWVIIRMCRMGYKAPVAYLVLVIKAVICLHQFRRESSITLRNLDDYTYQISSSNILLLTVQRMQHLVKMTATLSKTCTPIRRVTNS